MRRDELDDMIELVRQEIGAEVDQVLDDCLDHPALQGEAAQMTIEFVREKLNAIFVSQEDDDE
jgi:hypothetical protein